MIFSSVSSFLFLSRLAFLLPLLVYRSVSCVLFSLPSVFASPTYCLLPIAAPLRVQCVCVFCAKFHDPSSLLLAHPSFHFRPHKFDLCGRLLFVPGLSSLLVVRTPCVPFLLVIGVSLLSYGILRVSTVYLVFFGSLLALVPCVRPQVSYIYILLSL